MTFHRSGYLDIVLWPRLVLSSNTRVLIDFIVLEDIENHTFIFALCPVWKIISEWCLEVSYYQSCFFLPCLRTPRFLYWCHPCNSTRTRILLHSIIVSYFLWTCHRVPEWILISPLLVVAWVASVGNGPRHPHRLAHQFILIYVFPLVRDHTWTVTDCHVAGDTCPSAIILPIRM